MNKTFQNLLIVLAGAFVAIQYVLSQMGTSAPDWMGYARIVLLVLLLIMSFVFSIDYDRHKDKNDKDSPKSLTKNLVILYIVLAFLYFLFKLRGVV